MEFKKLFDSIRGNEFPIFVADAKYISDTEDSDAENNSRIFGVDQCISIMDEYDRQYGTNFRDEYSLYHTDEFVKYFLLHCFGGVYITQDMSYNDILQISKYCENRKIDIFESKDLLYVNRPHLSELDKLVNFKHENKESEHIEHSHKMVMTPLTTKEYLKIVKDDITGSSNHQELKQLMLWTLSVGILTFIFNLFKR